ncbi:MAG: hypothetical protein ABH856_02190 [Patescibacteria group bacterium]|nr:pilin [Patescibacteria group bacterium]
MAKTLKQFLLVAGLMVVGLLLVGYAPAALAAMIGAGDAPGNIVEATGGEASARSLIVNIINFFLFFLGLIATIMIIYGGVTYVTAGGEQEKIESAKKIIMYAVIGIIIVLLSFAIVNTILQSGTGSEAGT